MKKRGFTLIELLVVIAIIGILATTLVPRLREQIAKANDSKAISTLGVVRTAVSVASVNKMITSTNGAISLSLKDDIRPGMSSKANDMVNTAGEMTIGGSRDKGDKELTYGGVVTLGYKDGSAVNTSGTGSGQHKPILAGIQAQSEDIEIFIYGKKELSTEGKEWIKY